MSQDIRISDSLRGHEPQIIDVVVLFWTLGSFTLLLALYYNTNIF